MMLNWNEYYGQVTSGFAEIGRLNHETLKGYRGLADAGKSTNLLGGKVRELIALAVAVTRACDGCIVTHTEAAIREGASREEIMEALGVAAAINAGSVLVFSTRVLDAYAARKAAAESK